MKHRCRSSAGIFVAVFLISNALCAKKDTCADMMYRLYASYVGWSVGIPVAGWLIGALTGRDIDKLRKKVIVLNTATRIFEKKSKAKEADPQDIERLDIFYRKIIRLYPKTELSRKEVIEVLHKYNKYGVKNGTCNMHENLYTKLFPENRVQEFKKSHAVWQRDNAKIVKAHARAAKIRNQKNKSDKEKDETDVVYYEEGVI